MQRNLGRDERSEILFLHRKGYNISEISRELNVTRATVRRWIQRNNEEGTIADRPRAHPPRILTAERVAQMVDAYKQKPSIKTATFAQKYDCSMQAIRNALHQAGVHWTAKKKLGPARKKKRRRKKQEQPTGAIPDSSPEEHHRRPSETETSDRPCTDLTQVHKIEVSLEEDSCNSDSSPAVAAAAAAAAATDSRDYPAHRTPQPELDTTEEESHRGPHTAVTYPDVKEESSAETTHDDAINEPQPATTLVHARGSWAISTNTNPTPQPTLEHNRSDAANVQRRICNTDKHPLTEKCLPDSPETSNFDIFGRAVAAQLSTMSPDDARELQARVQRLMHRKRSRHRPVPAQYPHSSGAADPTELYSVLS